MKRSVARGSSIVVALLCGALASAAPASSTTTAAATARRPNLLVVVADDLGFADIGVTGSEIRTPTLDRLARQGILWTQFRASPACSTSRAMLLTGRDHHRVGFGNMRESIALNQYGQPGYEGALSASVPTVAEILRANGYRTYMAGKWHLGFERAEDPAARGFDRSFAMLHWGSGNFPGERSRVPDTVPSVRGLITFRRGTDFTSNGVPVDTLPQGTFSSDYYVERLLADIRSAPADAPFFAYLAFNAPHVPIQAPHAWRRRQAGRYDAGPSTIRERRIAAARARGVFAADAVVAPMQPGAEAWRALDPARRRLLTRVQESYAAMVEEMDAALGHLLAELRRDGRLDDTVVMFLSDNGPAANETSPDSWYTRWIEQRFDNSLANIGAPNSELGPGRFWAQVGSGPLRSWKLATYEGGLRVPLIVAGRGVTRADRPRSDALHILDLAPTLLELAGVRVDAGMSLDGRSFKAALAGDAAAVHPPGQPFAFEFNGARALIEDGRKAVFVPTPRGRGRWELYDLNRDPGESRDLAAEQPDVLRGLVTAWDAYADRVGVITPDEPLIRW